MLTSRNIIKFWRNLELFRPFSLNDIYVRYPDVIEISTSDGLQPPWIDGDPYGLDPGCYYGFDVFLGIFSLEETKVLCDQLLPPSRQSIFQDDRSFEGLSAVLRLSIDPRGEALLGQTSISTLPFAFEQFRATRYCDLHYFDEKSRLLLMALSQILLTNAPVRLDDLFAAEKACVDSVALPLKAGELVCAIIPHRLRTRSLNGEDDTLYSGTEESRKLYQELISTIPKRRKVDILNSFYLRDLDLANTAIALQPDTPLADYLNSACQAITPTREPTSTNKIDVRTPAGLDTLLEFVRSTPPLLGNWPTERDFSLSPEQDYALRRIVFDQSPLVAVNGAPGTGKSTIIRELLAHLISARATILAKLPGPIDALQKNKTEVIVGTKTVYIRQLIPEITGYELLLASSNNHAVENISLELPRTDRLPHSFRNITYLSQIAALYRHVIEQSSRKATTETSSTEWWGLPTIPLGKKSNRTRFIKAAFSYAISENKDDRATRLAEGQKLTLFELRAKAPDDKPSFRGAQKTFLDILHNNSSDSIALEEQRARLFIAALQLHEAWLREVPFLENELIALRNLLNVPNNANHPSVIHLWRLLFMITPLVSTTLASVERMFPGLQSAELGYGIIDEAGQAIPQSACGILMRVKKALIIGDQRQLQPISHLGEDIESGLAEPLSESIRKHTSALTSSAQSIADSCSNVGTYLYPNGINPLWISLPLMTHRRCAEPMFTISNTIAYDGMMRQAAPDKILPHPLIGPSAWWHIEGTATEKQWVPEQGELVKELILMLLDNEAQAPSFFMISPFRSVAGKLKVILNELIKKMGFSPDRRQEYRRSVGTVHTFQGREADVVFFVLGCDQATSGAAFWAGNTVNLINVAVTRARKYLYVIGDRHVWHNKGYFSDLEKMLPVALTKTSRDKDSE